MDHHGVLNFTRKIGTALREYQEAKKNIKFSPEWRWSKSAIICPEIPCFACKAICKTNIIMFYSDEIKNLYGQFSVIPNGQVKLGLPFHTHTQNTKGSVCTGRAATLSQLLLSPPTAHGNWQWDVKMVQWMHIYAQHNCKEMEKWWKDNFPTYPYPWSGPFAKGETKIVGYGTLTWEAGKRHTTNLVTEVPLAEEEENE